MVRSTNETGKNFVKNILVHNSDKRNGILPFCHFLVTIQWLRLMRYLQESIEMYLS